MYFFTSKNLNYKSALQTTSSSSKKVLLLDIYKIIMQKGKKL
jgi:hypothetical protein